MSNVRNGKRETEKRKRDRESWKVSKYNGKTFIVEIEKLGTFFHTSKIIEYESQFVLNANQSWELS